MNLQTLALVWRFLSGSSTLTGLFHFSTDLQPTGAEKWYDLLQLNGSIILWKCPKCTQHVLSPYKEGRKGGTNERTREPGWSVGRWSRCFIYTFILQSKLICYNISSHTWIKGTKEYRYYCFSFLFLTCTCVNISSLPMRKFYRLKNN